MPYIVADRRQAARTHPTSAGELNFAFTDLIRFYLESRHLDYQTINDVVGALEGAKAEFQRQIVQDYEDKKRMENGEVY